MTLVLFFVDCDSGRMVMVDELECDGIAQKDEKITYECILHLNDFLSESVSLVLTISAILSGGNGCNSEKRNYPAQFVPPIRFEDIT